MGTTEKKKEKAQKMRKKNEKQQYNWAIAMK
jgi:hypothetical protein